MNKILQRELDRARETILNIRDEHGNPIYEEKLFKKIEDIFNQYTVFFRDKIVFMDDLQKPYISAGENGTIDIYWGNIFFEVLLNIDRGNITYFGDIGDGVITKKQIKNKTLIELFFWMGQMLRSRYWINKKNGCTYTVLCEVINSTNKDDGKIMIFYERDDMKYVREKDEFLQKFDRIIK